MATSFFNAEDKEIELLNKQYVSGYTSLYELFSKNVIIHKATEGQYQQTSISLNDLNLRRTSKADTEIAKTTAVQKSSSFIKRFYVTEIQKSDYQAEGIEFVHQQVLDALKREYDFRFINGDEFGNTGLMQSTSTDEYNIMTSETQPTTADGTLDLLRRMLKLSLKAGNGEKIIVPFGTFAAKLYTNISGTDVTYANYIKQNIDMPIKIVDSTSVEGIKTEGDAGLLVADTNSIFLNCIREPNLKKIFPDKLDKSYIYESSTISCDPKANGSIVRMNFSN